MATSLLAAKARQRLDVVDRGSTRTLDERHDVLWPELEGNVALVPE